MEIVEKTNDGLKRAYTLTIPAKEIEDRVSGEIAKIAPQVRMPGFRPGKVPANLVRKMHGEQLHAQAVQQTVEASVDQLMQEKKLQPAMQPRVALNDDYEEGKDAELTVELEVLPKVDAPDMDGLELEKLVVPVDESKVDEQIEQLAGNQKSYEDAPKSRKAKDGDQLIIDFVGKLDGEAFEGGSAEGSPLLLGGGQFIPGFEDQLVGVKAGEEKTITVTFPEDYPADNLAGKEAQFDVTVQKVQVAGELKIDDEFAKNLGLESLDQLKDLLRGQLQQETDQLTRVQMKRALLDKLAAGHDFDVPPSMVDAEFEQIWQQLQREAEQEEDPEAAKKQIEEEKDDYRKIAERRVRLGLLLSEIGKTNNVEVSGQEMNALIQQAAQQYGPEDRERFMELVQTNPMFAAQLRAPLYEDKVVDFLFDKADVTEREVTREELQAAIEAEEDEAPKPAKKAAAKKKPAAKKAPAKKASTTKEDADKPAAKKAPAKKASAKSDMDEKPAAKKAPAKKAPAKKASAKSDADEKPAAKKSPAKKPAAKKAPAKK